MAKIILFDLDEVLIRNVGKGSNVFHNRLAFSVNKLLGAKTEMSMVETSGKTDTSIMIELARLAGIDKTNARSYLEKLWKEGITYCKRNFNRYTCSAYPGANPLLRRLTKLGYPIGLATGNLKQIALMKLSKAGIDSSHFSFGGFGTNMTRAEVIRAAIKGAKKKYGKIRRKDVFYFGDSPLDVIGGKKTGVRVVAVATGGYTKQQLSKRRPKYLLDDLTDTEKIIGIINSE